MWTGVARSLTGRVARRVPSPPSKYLSVQCLTNNILSQLVSHVPTARARHSCPNFADMCFRWAYALAVKYTWRTRLVGEPPARIGGNLALLVLWMGRLAVLRILILTMLVAGLIGMATWYIVSLAAPLTNQLLRGLL